jgi:hypothetical protein
VVRRAGAQRGPHPEDPNLLEWHRRLYCIDHGASLYVHHDWASASARAASSFPQIKDHVLLPVASEVRDAGERLRPKLSVSLFRRLADVLPDVWLPEDPDLGGARAQRHAYVEWLSRRLENAGLFEEEADRARGPARLTTPWSGWCRGWSAASS